MASVDAYSDFLERLADQHQRRLAEALQVLERSIAALVDSAPQTPEGDLFDAAWAVEARTSIRQAMEQDYLQAVQEVVGDYRGVASEQLAMLQEFGEFTRLPPEAISGLQRQSFQGFEAIANQQLDVLSKGVYEATLTGRSKSSLVEELRGSINGIYQASDQEEIRQLVEVAQNTTGATQKAAVDKLHSVYAADRLGNNMRRYATQLATDSLNQYSATLTATTANEQGIDHFRYYGDLITDSRDWCRDIVNEKDRKNLYTREEMDTLWEDKAWAGKAPGDPLIVRGGYNCRHQWLPVFVDDDEEEAPEVQESTAKVSLGFGETWDNLANSKGGIRPEAVKIMSGLNKPRSITADARKAYYDPSTRQLVTHKGDKGVFLHEYGHHIDHDLAGGKFETVSETFFPEAAKADAISLGVNQDFFKSLSTANKVSQRSEAVKDKVKELRDDLFELVDYIPKRGKYKGQVRGRTTEPKIEGAEFISDIIDSMSQGAMHEIGGWGHGANYYMNGNFERMRQTENFANMFALWSQNGEAWVKAQGLFPKLTAEFLDIVGEFG